MSTGSRSSVESNNSALAEGAMITRRDTLLVRPWQQRQYNQHRIKVLSALPAVDVAPPPQREHVFINLKQVQKEKERCEKIDQDNWRLVQRLAGVMRTSRVDNRWERPQPVFLQRVGIYHSPRAHSAPCRLCPHLENGWHSEDKSAQIVLSSDAVPPRNRNCLACHPETARRKLRELSSQPKPAELKDTEPQSNMALRIPDSRKNTHQKEKPRRRCPVRRGKSAPPTGPFHQLVVSYDALRLAVNFPAHASVLLPSGRTLQCHCPRLPPVL